MRFALFERYFNAKRSRTSPETRSSRSEWGAKSFKDLQERAALRQQRGKLNRVPTTEYNVEQTVASRAAVEAFLKKTSAQLWIQHDFTGSAKLKKAPLFYE